MGWKETSDGGHKDKINVDLDKGRVTHERISKGEKHSHEWIDTRQDKVKYGYRGENSGSSDSDSGSSRVICTHFYRSGKMDVSHWRADMKFTSRLSPQMVRGYHLWAIPYVRLMRRSRLAEAIMLPIATARAKEIAYLMGIAPRGSVFGRCVRLIGEPLCFVLGGFVSEGNWQSLWNNENTRAEQVVDGNPH